MLYSIPPKILTYSLRVHLFNRGNPWSEWIEQAVNIVDAALPDSAEPARYLV